MAKSLFLILGLLAINCPKLTAVEPAFYGEKHPEYREISSAIGSADVEIFANNSESYRTEIGPNEKGRYGDVDLSLEGLDSFLTDVKPKNCLVATLAKGFLSGTEEEEAAQLKVILEQLKQYDFRRVIITQASGMGGLFVLADFQRPALNADLLEFKIKKFAIQDASAQDVIKALVAAISDNEELLALLEIHERPIISKSRTIKLTLTVENVSVRELLKTLAEKLNWSNQIELSKKEDKIAKVHLYQWRS